jgi:polyisoprenoid-binding protein YceI
MTSPPPGDLDIGPRNGRLRLRTYRQGVAAKAGHDLVLEAASWNGRVRLPPEDGAAPSVEVEVDLRRLDVVDGTGGVKPLSERDKADIRTAMQKPLRTDSYPVARFTSSHVQVDGDQATVVGDLFLAGQTHPLELALRKAHDGTIVGSAQVVQTAWGIKPYTGLLGALKLRDAVDVEVELQVPAP